MGLRTFTLAGEPLQCNYFAVCGSLTHDVTKASLIVSFHFFCVSECKIPFLVVSSLLC